MGSFFSPALADLQQKDEKPKKENSFFSKKTATKGKLRPEFQMEVTDIHTKQRLLVSLEDLGTDQIVGHLHVKYGMKNDWRLQYCVLETSNLYIFKTTPDDRAWKIGISKGFTVETVELEDLPGCFKFTTPPDHTFFFQAEDVQERDVWVSALQKALVSSVGRQVVRNTIGEDGIKVNIVFSSLSPSCSTLCSFFFREPSRFTEKRSIRRTKARLSSLTPT